MLKRIAERQIGKNARLLLELRRHARVNRIVTAVMRTRRDFVHEQLTRRRDEHLDAQNAAVIECGGDVVGELTRALG